MKKSLRTWKKISGKLVYQNPWIKLHEDQVLRPDGKKGIYGYLEKPTGVFIIPYSNINKSVYLLKQKRYPVRKTIYEIPAGVVGNTNHLSEAKRELFEETGFRASRWQYLGHFFVAPGHETTNIKVYLASGLSDIGRKKNTQEGDEAIQKVVEVKIDKLPRWISKGRIECGITLASLNLFFQSLK
jgi:8-oxo-dGTP pyrophosphatase MutT (NUDIX family)